MTKNKIEIKNAVALVFNVHRWGNRKSVDSEKVEAGNTDKKLLHTTKNLIDPNGEIKEIQSFMYSTVKKWVVNHSVPAFFQDGVYLFHKDKVEEVEAHLLEFQQELKQMLEAFLAVYPQRINEVKQRLAENYNAKDYPTAKELRERYRFSWQWVEFGVPQELPEDIYKMQKKRAEAMWTTAAEQITMALRASFLKLVNYATEALKVGKDGKTKAFRDSTFDNISEFIELFKSRNLTNDTELAALVSKANKVMTGFEDPQALKKDAKMRKAVEKGFKEIINNLDEMVITKPSRKFNFDD